MTAPPASSTVEAWLRASRRPKGMVADPAPIPETFRTATTELIPSRALRTLVRTYGERFWELASSGVAPLLLGPPGMYKSLAVAVLTQAVHDRLRLPVCWVDCVSTLGRLDRRRFGEETSEEVARWVAVPWLVLDDAGMAAREPWMVRVVSEVVHARYDAQRPTCCTANIAPQYLDRELGASVGRRLRERSAGYRLYVTGGRDAGVERTGSA